MVLSIIDLWYLSYRTQLRAFSLAQFLGAIDVGAIFKFSVAGKLSGP